MQAVKLFGVGCGGAVDELLKEQSGQRLGSHPHIVRLNAHFVGLGSAKELIQVAVADHLFEGSRDAGNRPAGLGDCLVGAVEVNSRQGAFPIVVKRGSERSLKGQSVNDFAACLNDCLYNTLLQVRNRIEVGLG